ncbi:MAG: glycosyltransferase family 2 protein [Phycisphaerales bacterium]|nr:glycosyltransferase family 2 protein [Phycisphaerales bacterium]
MPEPADSPDPMPALTLEESVTGVFRAPGGAEAASRRAAVVRAVVPCFNRQTDLDALLSDLDRLVLSTPEGEIRLDVLVIDNASEPALRPTVRPATVPVQIVRLPANTGGSGGFNAGMQRLLAEPWGVDAGRRREFLWLIDSDVRLRPDTLKELLLAMEARSDLVVAGAAIADPGDGRIFEVGGRVNRRTGVYGPALPEPDGRALVECDYVASACALVRRWAVEHIGLMPDRFLNGDDVEWCIRLARETGGVVAAVPSAIAMHPKFDRFPTHLRFFGARSAMGPVAALQLRRRVRFRRALRETARAVNQELMGRADLAALHLRGLHAALAHHTTGPAAVAFRFERFRPWDQLGEALREIGAGPGSTVAIAPGLALPAAAARAAELAVKGATGREIAIPRGESGVRSAGAWRGVAGAILRGTIVSRPVVAIAPAEGRASSWFAGRWLISAVPEGFAVRRIHRAATWARAAVAMLDGIALSLRTALSRGPLEPLPPAHEPVARSLTSTHHPIPAPPPAPRPLSLSIVILSYNRGPALERTLEQIAALYPAAAPRETEPGRADPSLTIASLMENRAEPAAAGPGRIDIREVIVVDNASSDGTPGMIRARYPGVSLLALPENRGVEAFNRGVASAVGDAVLILDDDAWVDGGVLAGALDLLSRRPDLAAVTFEPRHPSDGRSEWKFAARTPAGGMDRWPVMGCANLVRREDWMRVGGYERAFFLYRNDVDLALKLLESGRGVHFNPAWTAMHDSPAAARKSRRWFGLATRNWVWMARRHGRGPGHWPGALAGWAWAHRLARFDLAAHWEVLKGGLSGAFTSPPPLPPSVRSTGRDWAEFLRLHVSRTG